MRNGASGRRLNGPKAVKGMLAARGASHHPPAVRSRPHRGPERPDAIRRRCPDGLDGPQGHAKVCAGPSHQNPTSVQTAPPSHAPGQPPSPSWGWGHLRHGDDDEDEDFRHDGPDHPRSTVEHRAKSLGMVPPWPERPGPPQAVQEPDHRRPRPQEPRRRREWPGTQTGHSGLFLAHDQVRTICRSTPWARSLILS